MKDVKVLVVDDNALILDLLMKGLMAHCDAHAAADGADALLKIVDDPPDLILCDYRMPGLDGRQLYEKLRARQQTKQIPFIFLANRGDIEEKLRREPYGFGTTLRQKMSVDEAGDEPNAPRRDENPGGPR